MSSEVVAAVAVLFTLVAGAVGAISTLRSDSAVRRSVEIRVDELQNQASAGERELESLDDDERIATARYRELAARLQSTRAELAELQSTVPFQDEARRSKWAARGNQVVGVVIIAVVIGIGVSDWFDEETTDLSTGAGLARLGVIAASFFLAGQLFRRATVLANEAAEFQRGAIAMRFVRELSNQITSIEQRDALVRSVYQSHLSRAAAPAVESSDSPDATSLVARLAELLSTAKKP